MTKFYVQSGTLRTTVQAETSRRAALWAVHQAMQQVLPLDECDNTSVTAKSENASPDGIRVMDQNVHVSQRGFGASDTKTLSTMEVVQEWNEMFAALDRLQRMLQEGGIAA